MKETEQPKIHIFPRPFRMVREPRYADAFRETHKQEFIERGVLIDFSQKKREIEERREGNDR